MSRRALAVLSLLLAVSCSPAAPPAAPPLASGLDVSAFDRSVRPQDDIYRHVNGGWLARTTIPADKASYGSFYEVYDRTQEHLKAIVEEAATAPDKAPGSDAQKLGDFYLAYTDEARIEALGVAPLRTELARVDAVFTRADLARYLARMLMLDMGAPLQGGVDGDAQDPRTNVLTIAQGGLGLPDRDYYLGSEARLQEYRAKYLAYIATLLRLAGEPDADAAARDVMAFETRLARSHWTAVASRDAVKTYNRVALDQLAVQFPGFDWPAWTEALGVSGVTAVVVAQPSFVKAFAAATAEIPVARWKPYLKFHTANALAPFLPKAFVDARFDLYGRTLQGVEQIPPRWRRALTNLEGALGELLGKAYVARHFTPAAKARMEQLVGHLRDAFRDGIDGLEWMGPETKKEAQAKLAAFRPKIGYPARWRDYAGVEIRADDAIGNVLRARIAESTYQLRKAGRPVDPEEWGMTPQTVNAYYNPVRNEIVFPAAMLQPPFFDMAADDAVNFGGIGGVIGHEMGHGFDDQGRLYDARGAMRDWWTAQDAEAFTTRAKGLVQQYDAIEPLPGLHVNGALTLGENIGDLTGVTIAHRAYALALGGQEPPVIDGMSGHERFFFGWAQAWRGKVRDDALRQQLMVDPHAPDPVRGVQPLPNVPAFYATFGVKDGDKLWLPPERRVRIW